MINVDLVFDRETLYEKIWGMEALGDNATVAVHINRLREKLEKNRQSLAIYRPFGARATDLKHNLIS